MSRNKSRSWAQTDVSTSSISRQPACIKQSDEERLLFKGTKLTGELFQSLPNRIAGWNVTKKKRSGGGKMRSVNVNGDCTPDDVKMMTVDSHMLAPAAYTQDTKTVHAVTGISNQVGMDVLTSFRQRKELFSKRHLEKFLTGKSPRVLGPEMLTTKMKSATSRARVPHTTGFSSSTGNFPQLEFELAEGDIVYTLYLPEHKSADETTHGHSIDQSVRKLPENGGPLYKRLLSAIIDENQDLDHISDGNYSSSQPERSDPPRMQDWEVKFLGSVPDENLLLKELHLIGIYPDKLPGLIEGDVGKDQYIQEPHGINSKLEGEPPFKNMLLTQKSSRSKSVDPAIAGTANGKYLDVYHQHTVPKDLRPLESDPYVYDSWNNAKGSSLSGTKNCSSELSLPKDKVVANKKKKNVSAPYSSAKRKRGRRGDGMNFNMFLQGPVLELDDPASLLPKSFRETKSKNVTHSVPKGNFQRVKPASYCPVQEVKPVSSGPRAEQVIIGESPIEGPGMISSGDALEDLDSLLDLEVDLLQDSSDNLYCLDIPMDDLSTLDIIF